MARNRYYANMRLKISEHPIWVVSFIRIGNKYVAHALAIAPIASSRRAQFGGAKTTILQNLL